MNYSKVKSSIWRTLLWTNKQRNLIIRSLHCFIFNCWKKKVFLQVRIFLIEGVGLEKRMSFNGMNSHPKKPPWWLHRYSLSSHPFIELSWSSAEECLVSGDLRRGISKFEGDGAWIWILEKLWPMIAYSSTSVQMALYSVQQRAPALKFYICPTEMENWQIYRQLSGE